MLTDWLAATRSIKSERSPPRSKRRHGVIALTRFFFFFSSFVYFSAAIRHFGVSLLPPSVETFPADAHSCPGSCRRSFHTAASPAASHTMGGCVCVWEREWGFMGFFGTQLPLTKPFKMDGHPDRLKHKETQWEGICRVGSCAEVTKGQEIRREKVRAEPRFQTHRIRETSNTSATKLENKIWLWSAAPSSRLRGTNDKHGRFLKAFSSDGDDTLMWNVKYPQEIFAIIRFSPKKDIHL